MTGAGEATGAQLILGRSTHSTRGRQTDLEPGAFAIPSLAASIRLRCGAMRCLTIATTKE